jgi:hypothetical protein
MDVLVGQMLLQDRKRGLLLQLQAVDLLEDPVELFAGDRPSGERLVMPSRTCPSSPATRTMKNSSRLAAEIDRNRIRSSSGWLTLSVSSSTRRLNWSQENSRLTNRSGLVVRSVPGATSVSGLTLNSPMPAASIVSIFYSTKPNACCISTRYGTLCGSAPMR